MLMGVFILFSIYKSLKYDPFIFQHPVSLDGFDWNRPGTFGGGPANVMFDDDLLMDFTDILFSSLSNNQPFAFPNPREIGKKSEI